MEAKQILTQVFGTAAAALLTRWAWKEARRDWKDHRRLPLVAGPHWGRRPIRLVLLGALAALVLIVVGIINLDLVTLESPAAFVVMVGWLGIGLAFFVIGATARLSRRLAKGWISVTADDTLRIEVEGTAASLKVRPGMATLRFAEGGGRARFVQLDLDDGTTRAHVWGMVNLRDLKLDLPDGLVPARGLMVASSMTPLCRWLLPYLSSIG
jgi:hypothetical protein